MKTLEERIENVARKPVWNLSAHSARGISVGPTHLINTCTAHAIILCLSLTPASRDILTLENKIHLHYFRWLIRKIRESSVSSDRTLDGPFLDSAHQLHEVPFLRT